MPEQSLVLTEKQAVGKKKGRQTGVHFGVHQRNMGKN
jgi:hypothetical protein